MSTLSFALALRPYSKLPAPKVFDPGQEDTERGNIARAIPYAIGLLTIALTGTRTITLSDTINGQPIYAGQSGFLQIVQDGTGGWVPTYTNATATDGLIPPPSAGPFDATMYHWVFDGSVFILSLFAERYGAGGSDSALAMAQARIISALLPLPRVEVQVPGYALVFA